MQEAIGEEEADVYREQGNRSEDLLIRPLSQSADGNIQKEPESMSGQIPESF